MKHTTRHEVPDKKSPQFHNQQSIRFQAYRVVVRLKCKGVRHAHLPLLGLTCVEWIVKPPTYMI